MFSQVPLTASLGLAPRWMRPSDPIAGDPPPGHDGAEQHTYSRLAPAHFLLVSRFCPSHTPQEAATQHVPPRVGVASQVDVIGRLHAP